MVGVVVTEDVYQPQQDSRLLVDALARRTCVAGRRVADLCTGSGVVAITAAQLGADTVVAVDICPLAVRATEVNARTAGVTVQPRLGSWTQALECGPFDLVTCNPPYVPVGPVGPDGPDGSGGDRAVTPPAGRADAWNGGQDGRLILDPLCASAAAMLSRGGVLLLVQSEIAGIERSLDLLRESGLHAEICATQRIPLGPVLQSQSDWLHVTGRLVPGDVTEKLVVIRAVKR